MMAGNREIRHEEGPVARKRIDPREDPLDSGRLVNAEARLVMSTDLPCILKYVVARVLDDRFHPQICEAARMEHPGAVAGCAEHLGYRLTRHAAVRLDLY